MDDIHPSNKCEHGVYWPEGHKIAFYCQFCNPDENPDRKAEPYFPRRCVGKQMLRANLHDPYRCPECGSGVHYENEKSKRVWICADCGHEYRRQNANS